VNLITITGVSRRSNKAKPGGSGAKPKGGVNAQSPFLSELRSSASALRSAELPPSAFCVLDPVDQSTAS
jgi:hypothetical protein